MWAWLEDHKASVAIISAASVVMFFGSLLLLPVLVIRLPADYFLRRPVRDWPTRHPVWHLALVIGKNVLGVIVLLAGLAMLVLPGQGLLTILFGLILMDFPRKRQLERRLIRIKPVRAAANWIRQRYGRPPFEFVADETEDEAEGPGEVKRD